MCRQLAKRLEDSDEPQYAGVCYLATGCMHLYPFKKYFTVEEQESITSIYLLTLFDNLFGVDPMERYLSKGEVPKLRSIA